MFKLQVQADGDWKFEDSNEKLIYKIKKRDYGFEIEDDSENSLYKIKLKEDKTSLRDAKDQTTYYTKTSVKLEAFTCLGLDVIEDVRIRAGLLTAIQLND